MACIASYRHLGPYSWLEDGPEVPEPPALSKDRRYRNECRLRFLNIGQKVTVRGYLEGVVAGTRFHRKAFRKPRMTIEVLHDHGGYRFTRTHPAGLVSPAVPGLLESILSRSK